ncbi:MAG TPA: tyrosine-type recombinase/integrase [Mycobacteriales bacterium]|nr:tyrosine-type recombinase/integrase [Mycobacteriales bacterium]
MARRSRFGNVRKLPSGRYQARYTGPTGKTVNAPVTFDTKGDAEAWLSTERAALVRGAWLPADSATTLEVYANGWLEQRPLTPRTRALYRRLLDQRILPVLGATQMRRLSPAIVREWHAGMGTASPTAKAHAYSLLRSICRSAVDDDVIVASPCRIRGAGSVKRVSKTEPATLEELAAIVAAIPKRYQLMVLLATWCALRFGELAELRGADLDTKRGVVRVRRAVVWLDGEAIIGPPKSEAGVRDVAIPPHLLPAVRAHLLEFGVGRDGLLFPSASDPTIHMRPATLWRVWNRARDKAGRPDLRFHDLRHTGAVLAALSGATVAELMNRLGHSTPAMALHYQHVAQGRDAEIAKRLSELAT